MESDGGEDDEQLIIDVGGPPLNENLVIFYLSSFWLKYTFIVAIVKQRIVIYYTC